MAVAKDFSASHVLPSVEPDRSSARQTLTEQLDITVGGFTGSSFSRQFPLSSLVTHMTSADRWSNGRKVRKSMRSTAPHKLCAHRFSTSLQ